MNSPRPTITPAERPGYYQRPERVELQGQEFDYLTRSSRWIFTNKQLGLVVKVEPAESFYPCQCCREFLAWHEASPEQREFLAPTLAAGHADKFAWTVQELIEGKRPNKGTFNRAQSKLDDLGFMLTDRGPHQWIQRADGKPKLVDYGIFDHDAPPVCGRVAEVQALPEAA